MESKIDFVLCLLQLFHYCTAAEKPNIVMIVADDLGWDDVSFHGSTQIPTPNLDKLALNGVILNNYYVTPMCTPSRSAIMTGKYPIHTGMQTDVVIPTNAWGLDTKETILPQYLKRLGYRTHAIGKWHLGMCSQKYLPNNRGFDSFYGFYHGRGDYWGHSNSEEFWGQQGYKAHVIGQRQLGMCSKNSLPTSRGFDFFYEYYTVKGDHWDHFNKEIYWGLDLHDNGKPVLNQWGNYSTDMYTEIAIDKIKSHDKSEPLFLYLAYQAVHSTDSDENPIQAPEYWLKKFKYIKNEGRRKFAAVTAALDDGVGRVYNALSDAGMLDNTVIVFTTDNGGPFNGYDLNYASNHPLRGGKEHLWEGGVRGVGFVNSKLIKKPGRVSHEMMHITDWLPTFIELAGGNSSSLAIDGLNIWNSLSNGKKSPREEVLLNIDPWLIQNAALRVGNYKVVTGERAGKWSGWMPTLEADLTKEHSHPLVKDAAIKCGPKPANVTEECSNVCLFNIAEDPCEYNDLSEKLPDLLKTLLERLDRYRGSMVMPRVNITMDPFSNPKLHGGSWEPWLPIC